MRLVPAAACLLSLAALVAGGACRRTKPRARTDAAAVVVVAAVPDAVAALVPEREPNDERAAAQELSLAGDPLAGGVQGTLSAAGKTRDLDMYKLVIPGAAVAPIDGAVPTRRLAIELVPAASMAAAIQLMDAQGRPITTSPGGRPGDRDGIPNVAVAAGAEYFVRVRPLAAPAPAEYQLLARLGDFEIGEEREPNDDLVTAGVLVRPEAGVEVAGYHAFRLDTDWYAIAAGLPQGAAVDLELDPPESVAASLAIHDGKGTRAAGARGGRGQRVSLRNVLAASPAYVVVRAETGRDLDRRYVLRVRTDALREGMEVEPNDHPPNASPIGEGSALGYLPVGDVDHYRFTAPAPGRVEIEVSPPERVNVSVEVTGSAGVLAKADAAGRGKPERLSDLPYGGEPLVIRVAAARGEGSMDEPYELRVTTRAPQGGP